MSRVTNQNNILMKRILLFVLCLALFACTEEPKPGKIVSIELTEENLTILVGEFGSTIAYVEMDNPENCNSTVEWSSSNESIAVAHANGDECLIEGISPGEAIITANTPEGLSATCKVTVVAKVIPVTGISLSRSRLEILENRTETLTAFLKPSDATNTKVTWSSTDESIATVNDGTVRGIKPGRAKIKAETEDGGFVAECDVTVTKDYQSQSKGPVTLKLGNVTASTVTFFGTLDVDQLGDYDMDDGGVGFIYTTTDKTLNVSNAKKVKITTVGSNNEFSFTYTGLPYDTRYHYTVFLYKNGICQYGSTQYFKTETIPVTISADEITQTTATFKGKAELSEADAVEIGVRYSTKSTDFSSSSLSSSATEVSFKDALDGEGNFNSKETGLLHGTKYYYAYYIKQAGKYTFGTVQDFTTQTVVPNIDIAETTQTTATFSGTVPLTESTVLEVGLLYSSSSSDPKATTSGVNKVVLTDIIDADGNFTYKAENLLNETTHYYRYYIKQGSAYTYGDVSTFKTEKVPVTIEVESIDKNVVTFKGNVQFSEPGVIEIGVQYYPKSTTSQSAVIQTKAITEISENGDFTVEISGLLSDTEYCWQYYLLQNDVTIVGLLQTFEIADLYNVQSDLNMAAATDLSSSASANCYIISEPGLYKFKTVKGNSDISVGNVASASILWETFGTSTSPEYFDLVSGFCYKDGYIAFQTANAFKEGNAVIAAKDADGKILWSWHIWLTDEPQGQVYYNGAGTMMDRNLGATSATPGDVGALGLLYQWGRKDPFLGSSSISYEVEAKSTINWPLSVSSDSSNGTIEYATAHPTTFITDNSSNYDWYYTGDSSTDNTRWTTSETAKSIYDPCPAGWRVPDGGSNGIWSKAGFYYTTYDSTNEGISFSISSPSTTWYPASGCRYNDDGGLNLVCYYGYYWSASPNSSSAYYLRFTSTGNVFPSGSSGRAYGYSVRCLQE